MALDYSAWCDQILVAIQGAYDSSSINPDMGMEDDELGRSLFGVALVNGSAWHTSTQRHSLLMALEDLAALDLLIDFGSGYYKLGSPGRKYIRNHIPLWEDICSLTLEEPQIYVLRAVNNRAFVHHADHILVQ